MTTYYVLETSKNGKIWSRRHHQWGSYEALVESEFVAHTERVGYQWRPIKVKETVMRKKPVRIVKEMIDG